MKVYVESILECAADRAWSEVQTSRLLLEVMWPLLRLLPPHGTRFPSDGSKGRRSRAAASCWASCRSDCATSILSVSTRGAARFRRESTTGWSAAGIT